MHIAQFCHLLKILNRERIQVTKKYWRNESIRVVSVLMYTIQVVHAVVLCMLKLNHCLSHQDALGLLSECRIRS